LFTSDRDQRIMFDEEEDDLDLDVEDSADLFDRCFQKRVEVGKASFERQGLTQAKSEKKGDESHEKHMLKT
jgi:hypothetical protein